MNPSTKVEIISGNFAGKSATVEVNSEIGSHVKDSVYQIPGAEVRTVAWVRLDEDATCHWIGTYILRVLA